MNINIDDYKKRIVNASPMQLVIINFEIILDYLNCAKQCLSSAETDEPAFKKNMEGAHNFLKELIASLNFDYEISGQLMQIYLYVNKLLIKGTNRKDEKNIDEAISILTKLLDSFEKIKDTEADKAPVMENVSKVFAGLTYNSKGELSEFSDETDKKGYQA